MNAANDGDNYYSLEGAPAMENQLHQLHQKWKHQLHQQ